jgi:hypothetical protein
MRRRTRKTRIAEGMDPARAPDEVMTPEIVDRPGEKKRAGREPLLTQEVGDRVCDALSHGMFLSQAAKLAGVSPDTIASWRKRGETGEQPYADFLTAYEQAELECEEYLLKLWKNAAPDDWRAAKELLAKRFPERWSDAATRAACGEGVIHANLGGGLKVHIHYWEPPAEALPAPLPAIDVTPDRRLDNVKDSI